ncbi:bifunctional precorrin-2 dehydrogenase/sirohydrochlorin ferrochelatase [uncultured Microscilla sp.]|uniref:precorrin-2 dehydrogenase/sirohydrochlorin ferrochelatase family protein n=1 Tax=uncultured Microscilla sp. TaxID=432653 RepID=UPI0026181458|nr:bifunctional precorrin-2 dehydrogenase/sirohydrochlorin ferrochelatase [uncultured Microscilla sp.]
MATNTTTENTGNNLFPIFLKLHQLDILLVGAGNVGLEKLSALLKNSPEANVTVVADMVLPETRALIDQHPTVSLLERPYQTNDLKDRDLVICATDNQPLHQSIRQQARGQKTIINVADTPDLCDFYLGSVVKKGDLKIAISTNGKSPTLAKRMRQYFEATLPDNIQNLLDNLHQFRNRLKGDFQHKLETLNALTENMVANGANTPTTGKQEQQKQAEKSHNA